MSTEAEHYLLCGSAYAAPGQTQTLRLQMSGGLSDLTAGSSLTGATIWIEGGVVYYQAPSPLPRGASQDDFAVRGVSPNGEPVSDRCNIGLQSTPGDDDGAEQSTPPEQDEDAADAAAPGAPDATQTPSSASASAEGATESSSGPPIPGMPGYSLPEPSSSSTTASASPEQTEDPPQQAHDSELAATGVSTLQTVTAVVLALVAILAGAAAMVPAARRPDSRS